MPKKSVKKIVQKHYSEVATHGTCCCGSSADPSELSQTLGYSAEEIRDLSAANLGLGCGNPTALAQLKEGEIVLDLGSGAGLDCFLAAKKVGPTGKVIGVDMTEAMIAKAQENAQVLGFANVEFRLGDIDALPVKDSCVDVVISNCVVNLAPNKRKVFAEVHRVLKPDGRMYVSDIVLLKELSDAQRNDEALIAGCVGGAMLRDQYLSTIRKAGFITTVLVENTEISEQQYGGLPLESISVEARKQARS